MSNEELYNDYLIEEGSFVPLPEPYEIYDPDYNNYNRINAVLQNYENARKLIFLEYGWSSIGRYLENNGKLTDKVFMAMLAAGEFASETGEAFLESIEALSNQYYSQKSIYGPMQCFGSCDFITQILWATQMAAWFSNNFLIKSSLRIYGWDNMTLPKWRLMNITKEQTHLGFGETSAGKNVIIMHLL